MSTIFKLNKVTESRSRKGQMTVYLYRIGRNSNYCKHCQRTHDGDNQMFLEFNFDGHKRQSLVDLKCWTFINANKK